MDPAVIDDRRRTVSLSHQKWRFWAEIGMMRGRAGMRWDAWGSWDEPERGRVRICCKGAPRRDRRREEARNINVLLRAFRLDPGLCNRFGQPAPSRAPGGAPRASRRPRRAPRPAARAISIRTGTGRTPSRPNYVELGGFEPPTSSMPWKRATNCAIAPKGDRHRLAPGGWWS